MCNLTPPIPPVILQPTHKILKKNHFLPFYKINILFFVNSVYLTRNIILSSLNNRKILGGKKFRVIPHIPTSPSAFSHFIAKLPIQAPSNRLQHRATASKQPRRAESFRNAFLMQKAAPGLTRQRIRET